MFFILFLITVKRTYSCTIFYIEKDGIILAGNNEDWKDPASMMFFYPPSNGKHGWVKFGWGSGFPQGGMNDQGLFWDGTSGPYLEMPDSEAHKTKLSFPIMQKVIEECGTIEEAKAIFANFYHDDQYKAQYLLGDSSGCSMIVEGDNILDKEKDFQVLTNFYQSHPEMGGYPCWRYDKANELLEECDELNPYFVGEVLANTHQEGNYPTQYSNIYDLKNGLIYLFWFHNYEEFIKIDLSDELVKGYRSYDIPQLFSKIKLESPANGISVKTFSVKFSWKGIPGNSYEVVYSTSPDFMDFETAKVINATNNKRTVYLAFAPVFLFLLLLKFKKDRFMLIALSFLLFAGLRCEKDDPEPDNLTTVSKTVTNLLPGKTYYWKVRACSDPQKNFYSETIVFQFITGN